MIGLGGVGGVVDNSRAQGWQQFCETMRSLEPGTSAADAVELIGETRYRSGRFMQGGLVEFTPPGTSWSRAPIAQIYVQFGKGGVTHVELVPAGPIPFESEDWKRSWSTRRSLMRDDLLARHDLATMTTAAILELLGKPDRRGWLSPNDLAYRIGSGGYGFAGIDDEWIVVRVNAAGAVTAVDFASD